MVYVGFRKIIEPDMSFARDGIRPHRDSALSEEHFDASGDDDWSPRYNIAPTQPVPVIRQHLYELLPSRQSVSSTNSNLIIADGPEALSNTSGFRNAPKT
jgi:hypothetical protein